MTNKTISLPEEIYFALKKKKRKGESFPELITRLLKTEEERHNKLESIAGSLREDDEWDDIIEEIYKDRIKPTRL
ncbi:MAG: antitoxin VapB family protein [Promethearchaeota archaeon]